MNTIQALSMKTAAAMTRLSELELKKERPGADGRVTALALRELQSALEELRVAIDHLHEISDGLAATRGETQALGGRYDELLDAMPVACLFTDDEGIVRSANDAAARLLNISARHLAGKPLLLFVADREYFTSLLKSSGLEPNPVTTHLTVRPRDRKSRVVSVHVRHLPQHGRRCWFFSPESYVPSDSGVTGSGVSPSGE